VSKYGMSAIFSEEKADSADTFHVSSARLDSQHENREELCQDFKRDGLIGGDGSFSVSPEMKTTAR